MSKDALSERCLRCNHRVDVSLLIVSLLFTLYSLLFTPYSLRLSLHHRQEQFLDLPDKLDARQFKCALIVRSPMRTTIPREIDGGGVAVGAGIYRERRRLQTEITPLRIHECTVTLG
jgi:hypothetical protein